MYPLTEMKALVKAQQWAQAQGLELASVRLWYSNLALEWDRLVLFAQAMVLEKVQH